MPWYSPSYTKNFLTNEKIRWYIFYGKIALVSPVGDFLWKNSILVGNFADWYPHVRYYGNVFGLNSTFEIFIRHRTQLKEVSFKKC